MTCKRNYCCVYNCLTNNTDNKSFFSLPSDDNRCDEWLKLIHREDLKTKQKRSYRVCEKHFKESDIMTHSTKRSLKKGALPVLCIPNPQDEARDIETEHIKEIQAGAFLNQAPPYFVVMDEPCATVMDPITFTTVLATVASAGVAPAGVAPAGVAPAGVTPAGVAPAAVASAGVVPAGVTLAGVAPAGVTLAGVAPAGERVTPPFAESNLKRKLEDQLEAVNVKCSKSLTTGAEDRVQSELFFRLCDQFLNKNLSSLVETHVTTSDRSDEKGKSEHLKHLCLKLYFSSPDTYRFLQGIIFLPSIKTLKRLHVPLTTDINENLMSTLKCKVELMLPKQKYCAVCICAIRLRPNLFYATNLDKIVGFQEIEGIQTPDLANYALVMMVRGVFSKWDLPFAYAFLAELSCKMINGWIDRAVEKLFDIGLVVCALISDFGKELLNAAALRQVTLDRPYFNSNGKKIFFMFDPPDLITLMRNALMKYNFHINGGIASNKHIEDYYRLDEKQRLRFTPRLTSAHVTPSSYHKNKPTFVKELFNLEVAAAMSTYIEVNALDASAKHTMELLVKMSNLLYCLNYSYTKADDEFNIKGRPSPDWVLKDSLAFFENLKLISPGSKFDVTHNEKFIAGFQLTIKAILCLYDDLKAVHKEKNKYTLTCLFNRSCLEYFMKTFRKENGIFVRPTCRRVAAAFKNIFVLRTLRAPPKNLSSACDTADVYAQLTDEMKTIATGYESADRLAAAAAADPGSSSDDITIKSSDYDDFLLPKTDALLYVSGYFLNKCLQLHNDCVLMNNYVSLNESRISKVINSGFINKMESHKGKVAVPPDDFVDFITNLETVFQSYFDCQIFNGHIAESLLNLMEPIKLESPPCQCFPQRYIKKLYIRLRLSDTLKYNNRLRHTPGSSGKGVRYRRFVVNPY